MRYSLLNFIVCQSCHADLTCVACREAPCETSPTVLSPCSRVSAEGAIVGPAPVWRRTTPLTGQLAQYASAPAVPDRDFLVAVDQGLLVCGECGRWYPVIDFVPELLPDHLRSWDRDGAFLDGMSSRLPAALLECIRGFRPEPGSAGGGGEHHKLAEIALPGQIADASFWGPGYSAADVEDVALAVQKVTAAVLA